MSKPEPRKLPEVSELIKRSERIKDHSEWLIKKSIRLSARVRKLNVTLDEKKHNDAAKARPRRGQGSRN